MNVELSIIIVNYRSWPYLETCLQSLHTIPSDWEIIVVDNDSDHAEINDFRKSYHKVLFIESRCNLGFGGGCRLGVLHAKGNYLIFLNPDTVAVVKTLYEILLFLKGNTNLGIASCRQSENLRNHFLLFPSILNLYGITRAVNTWCQGSKFNIKKWNDLEYITPDWVSGSFVMISTADYNAIGGWNSKYWMYYEDPDICKRMAAHGKGVALISNRFVQHTHGGSSRINAETTAASKTEVIKSKHVYITEHFDSISMYIAHMLIVFQFCTIDLVYAFLCMIFRFIPYCNVQFMIWKNRLKYYLKVWSSKSWLSEKTVSE